MIRRVVSVTIAEYRKYEVEDIQKARELIQKVVGLTTGFHFPVTKTGEDIPGVRMLDGKENGLKYIEWSFPPGSKGDVMKYRVSVVSEEIKDALAERLI